MDEKKYVIERIITVNFKKMWKMTVKEHSKVLESYVYKTLGAIGKRIRKIDEYPSVIGERIKKK